MDRRRRANDIQLRRASFILPKTGERSKRTFTLRDASNRMSIAGGSDGQEDESLLAYGDGRGYDTYRRHKTRSELLQEALRRRLCQFWMFAKSPTGQGIFKSSIAYLLGSMATLIPWVAAWFGGKNDSKHLVATITVYFHPARTVGSMHEAFVLSLIAFCYAAFLSFGSMAVSIFFAHQHVIMLGHAVVLTVFVAGGFGFMAWIKQRLGNPLVNVAISLASLGTINILIREGSVQAGVFGYKRITETLGMIILGIIIASVINVVLFPTLARKKLSYQMEKNTDLLGEMLISITRAFLHGREQDLEDEYFKTLAKEHYSSLNQMKKNLNEAKKEYYVLGRERVYAVEARVVRCLDGLSQDLGGLRSAALAQFSFINSQTNTNGDGAACAEEFQIPSTPRSPAQEREQFFGNLDVITELPESSAGSRERFTNNGIANGDTPITLGISHNMVKSPGDMFVAFITQLGPPTKSLVFTLKQTLDELPFREVSAAWNPWANRELEVAINPQFHASLKQAIDLYRQARKNALGALHQSRATLFNRRPEEVLADIEEVSACCGHFSFSLLDFAEDVLTYLEILDDLKREMESPGKSWKWLLFWKKRKRPDGTKSPRHTFPEHNEEPDTAYSIEPIRKADRFADPEKMRAGPWYYSLYRAFRWMRRDDTRFALKVGIGAALYALPAFLPETRPFFLHWRGEWGLVSYMVVCSMTVGATNTTGFNRIFGTLIGAACAVIAWLICSHDGVVNPYLLGFCGWIMSLPAFYINIAINNGPMARFIILTYNLSALYAYSLSIHDDDNDDDEGGIDPEIWAIVLHRVVSVTVGCAWAIIVCRWIMPISARNKLREGLCVLWLRMGLIWKRDPLAMFLLGEPRTAYMDIREESDLHGFLANLRSLRNAAKSEFEFQGPFPDQQIGRMLDRAGRMLDAFHAMNVVISKNLQCTPGEAAVLKYTRPERFALSARISHLFTVLASSIKLEYPLNDVLPNVEDSRDRLLSKISEFRRSGEARDVVTEQDYEMLYAYVLVTGQLAQDIEAVGQEIEGLFGVLNEENLKIH
ncbi:uncharacterized protein MYCFIDRAFT_140051 [Pseudocercospora fijiensis CIRAD86]|uniref:Integral membrane bound transporter domain-containing protein n=1 Tax=Pseudocercospora fijiensis (strain CIRAD86) TaxID=383855 RepID=M3A9T1_PSEFD|nr:uncharacterized protein MYCFIDRAFT_140051 [Pseudocercospora fijiensis CIRAD86]EME81386.1 hypothetical protein MYCFIDRAFT_140051 [Pseudocercospora fijiensis CIRAD86]